MPWKLNKNHVTPSVTLTNSEQANLNTFMNGVSAGRHPKEAASSWDSDYKKLAGTVNQYQIRLSQSKRATFSVDEAAQLVTMLSVGGHT